MSGTAGGNRKQPIKAWRCPRCGMINDVEWFAGTHADRSEAGMNGRCAGQPEGPFYLVHVDQYLDVMLALPSGGGGTTW